MGMQNPAVSEPLDKLGEVFPEGTPFIIDGIRIVTARTQDFGEGEMVVVKARGHDRELGVWGSYLLAQARSVDNDDLGRYYVVSRRVIDGFGKGRPVKVFDPVDPPAQGPVSSVSTAAGTTSAA